MPRHKHRSSLRRQRPHAASAESASRTSESNPWSEATGFMAFGVATSAELCYSKRRSLRELLTTETLLKAIAPAATMGFSSPAAARGMAAML